MGRVECVRDRWYWWDVVCTKVRTSGKGCGGIMWIEGSSGGSGLVVVVGYKGCFVRGEVRVILGERAAR